MLGLGARDLWNPDEADHAQAARELLIEHRWAVPTIAGETFAEKPPLQLWIIKLSAMARGTDVDPFDARLPSAIGNILIVIITYLLGKRAGGPWTGMLAALVAATTFELATGARWCQVDSLFCGFFACASFFTFESIAKANIKNTILLALALGLAILTKGPLAGALLCAAVGMDILLNPDHRRAWFGRAGIYFCIAGILSLVVAAPWYIALASADSDGLGRSIFHENISRFLNSQDHKNPFYYYIAGSLWTSLAPAAWLLPPALIFAFRTTRDTTTIWTRDRSPLRFALAAFLGGLLLLSAASSKQGKYLLPLTPFVALIVADFARNVEQFGAKWQRAWITTILSVFALVLVIFTLFSLAASWFGPRADDAFAAMFSIVGLPARPIISISSAIWALLPCGIGSFALLAVGIHTRASFRLAWFLAPLTLASAVAGPWVVPAFDSLKSPKPAVDRAMERLQIHRERGFAPRYAVYFPPRPAQKSVESWTGTSQFVYYAKPEYRRPLILRGEEAVRAALDDKQPLVFVTRADYLARLPADLRARLPVCFQKAVGSRTLVVVDAGG